MSDENVIAPIIITLPPSISISYGTEIDFLSWKASIYGNIPEYMKQYPEFFGPYSTSIQSEVTENPTKPWIIPNLISAFGNKLAAFATTLSAIPDTQSIDVGGGVSIPAGDIKRTLQNFQKIVIVDNNGMPEGYGGRNYGDKLYITIGTLNGYLAYDQNGINFLMLHEIAHNTISNMQGAQQLYDAHLKSGGTAATYNNGSMYFRQAEARTNYVATKIASATSTKIPPIYSGVGDLSVFPPYGTLPF